ncbi:hypothetical protein AVEN_108585-1 [Araneus ventricosus]|uniref:Uncharacterized protein n=1 Tax=Araneus ventricosus TaxID=182803 RepID=A0A4Y2DIK6_ARAVE|nr:hypothetical protein AVEN_108585-1 [Araneus ventricosus]
MKRPTFDLRCFTPARKFGSNAILDSQEEICDRHIVLSKAATMDPWLSLGQSKSQLTMSRKSADVGSRFNDRMSVSSELIEGLE